MTMRPLAMPPTAPVLSHVVSHGPRRRRLLGCCAAAAAGLFTSLQASAACSGPTPAPLRDHPLVCSAWQGLRSTDLWDVHAHLLGTGDSGSGCRIHPHLKQWWHPMENLRRRVIMGAACVADEVPSVDQAYGARLHQLTEDFASGARWMLFAFDTAHDDQGRERPDWSTFQVPNGYAADMAARHSDRFEWVASIHPYRADALERLDLALGGGARALKWLPSAMNIDLRDARLRPFYDRLARAGLPLIVHCGEEKAVPGAGRDDLGNPLLVRAPLSHGVRVIVAHCASLGHALDLDQHRPQAKPAFDLFARLMDEADGRVQLLGDVSAVFQTNRRPEVWHTILGRRDWQARLLYGSDYPLPGVAWLFRPGAWVRAGLLSETDVPTLQALQQANPLLFNLVLQRALRWRGQALSDEVFHTRRHFVPGARSGCSARVAKVSTCSTG